MNSRQLLRNISIAFLAQGISMLVSVFQSLIVPKILGVSEYGYWQLFIFYSTYVGVFHFGLNDGVYLINGGKSRAYIDKASINSQFLFGIAFQTVIASIIVSIPLSGGMEAERSFVVVCTGIFLVVQNAAYYLMYLLQAMNETRKSSYSTMVNRISFFLPMTVLLLCGKDSFKPYVIAYMCSALLQFLYCAYQCNDILRSGFIGWRKAARQSLQSIRVGIKLMIATLAGMLILGTIRQVIDVGWGIETFGKVSLSLSLVNFFLAFVSQAAMVLFPALRQGSDEEIRDFYVATRDILGVAFPVAYILYFPMIALLSVWLPAYADSLRYFALLIPICVFDSKMNITCTTLFKVRREENKLLIINLITVAICLVISLFGAFVLKSIEMTVAAATIAVVLRSIASEHIVSQELEVSVNSISIWELLLTGLFIFASLRLSTTQAFFVCAGAYALFLVSHLNNVKTIGSSLAGVMKTKRSSSDE